MAVAASPLLGVGSPPPASPSETKKIHTHAHTLLGEKQTQVYLWVTPTAVAVALLAPKRRPLGGKQAAGFQRHTAAEALENPMVC